MQHAGAILLALTISLVCGYIGYWLGLPLPWMLGPMIGNTVAAILHAPIRGPDRLRPMVMPIIGVMLGSSVTLALFAQLEQWVLALIALPVFLIIAAMLSYAVYRRIGRYDPVTAYYAAMPGGLNEMLLLGGAAGGDEKRIALAHAARILVVILFVVVFFWIALGVTSTGSAAWTSLTALTLKDYAILLACAVLGVWIGRGLRLPAAPVFGPMLLSAIAHMSGLVTVAPPTILIIAAQLVIGTVIGSRFVGARPRDVLRDLGLAAISASAMLVVAVGFAEAIALGAGIPLSQAFLAFSPGGLTEMSLLSLSMQQDVAFVTGIHLIRIIVVIGVAPFVFARIMR